MTVILYFAKFLSAHSLLWKTHNLSLTSVICPKRDCKSLNFWPFRREKSKWRFINKVPAYDRSCFTSGYFWSNLLRISIDSFKVTRSVFVYSTAERSLFADALRTNKKLMRCSFLLERKNNGEALWNQGKKVWLFKLT